MANNKFNFYKVYLNDLNKLNPFQFKKVINALCKYSETNDIPEKLSVKGMTVFNKIMVVIDTEKQMEMEIKRKKDAGKKGANLRWNGKNKHNYSKNIAETKHFDSQKKNPTIVKKDIFDSGEEK